MASEIADLLFDRYTDRQIEVFGWKTAANVIVEAEFRAKRSCHTDPSFGGSRSDCDAFRRKVDGTLDVWNQNDDDDNNNIIIRQHQNIVITLVTDTIVFL